MQNPQQQTTPRSAFPPPTSIRRLELESIPAGHIMRYWMTLAANGLGQAIRVPVMVAKGLHQGPVLGLTAAVHGNELNGLPVIQRLFQQIDIQQLNGTIVGVPVVNVPAFLGGTRAFNDGVDLNHIMPGKANGNNSQVYAHRIVDRIIRKLDYLLDLHTASFGRINAYYIRADMDDPVTAQMALLQQADIIVHNPPHDGTLRGAAEELGIHAITLEVGDPNTFQKGMIRSSLTGVHNLLIHLGMTQGEIDTPQTQTVLCQNSYWLYTDKGGVLEVFPNVIQKVKKGDYIANVRNIFGDIIQKYFAPEDGIVIGKSVNPVNQTGSRILHLGLVKE
ncbi:MAG: peptidase M14 [Bacteroidetes bacterium]|nr:MAG: peptidase M14 [Bacteroidota bacterium]